MSSPLDEQYLTWLYGQTAPIRLKNPSRTYWGLLRQMYKTQFVWLVPNDDNRIEDGRELRKEFIDEVQVESVDQDWLDLGCSMLEMLIALSRRLSFEADGEPRAWFWHLVENVDLHKLNDRHYDEEAQRFVDETLERIIWRRYEPDGNGGLFPLRNPFKDQREIELWYQASAYLVEQF